MTYEEVLTALEAGKRVFWRNEKHEVVRGEHGYYVLHWFREEYCDLLKKDSDELNWDAEGFYIYERYG